MQKIEYKEEFATIAYEYLSNGGDRVALGIKLVSDDSPLGCSYMTTRKFADENPVFALACELGTLACIDELTSISQAHFRNPEKYLDVGYIERQIGGRKRGVNCNFDLSNASIVDAAKKLASEYAKGDTGLTSREYKSLSDSLNKFSEIEKLDEAVSEIKEMRKEAKQAQETKEPIKTKKAPKTKVAKKASKTKGAKNVK